MALLFERADGRRAELAIPAGVVAQAWRGGARQARIAKLLQLQVTSVVALDTKLPYASAPPARRLAQRTWWT